MRQWDSLWSSPANTVCMRRLGSWLQLLLHHKFRFIKSPAVEQITVKLSGGEAACSSLFRRFREKKIEIVSVKIKREDGDILFVKLYVKYPASYSLSDVLALVEEVPEIQSADI